MSEATTSPPSFDIITTSSSWSSSSLESPSSIPPSSSSFITSTLFPSIHSADHFIDDDDDYYYDKDVDNFITSNNLANLSSSSAFPCIPSNASTSFSTSAIKICDDFDLTKTKIYSSEDLWAENEIFARKLAPAMVFIACLMMLGIVGNSLVVYVYGLRFKSATQHFLIVCLACFDLIMCLVAMPAEIADIRFHHTFTSVFACKLLRFVTMFASISSSFTLVTVAYDRHRRITRPLSKQISTQQARIWMLSNMAAALCFSWPTLVLTGIRSSETRISGLAGTDCSFSERFKKTKYPLLYNAVLGLGFFTLITVIAVFYFRIWKTARTRKINMAKRYTIGSLSDQFMSDLKLQKKIHGDEMSDILSKQFEKCVREKLQTKPSINCEDIYYFFENNSIRSSIGSEIAKRRGRYKGFSVTSSCSEKGYSRSSKNNEDSVVLGHSFSYRHSLYARRTEEPIERDEEVLREEEGGEGGGGSRKYRKIGRRSTQLAQSFTMAKIPENSSCCKLDTLQVHQSDTEIIPSISSDVDEFTMLSSFSYNKNNNNNDDDKNNSIPKEATKDVEICDNSLNNFDSDENLKQHGTTLTSSSQRTVPTTITSITLTHTPSPFIISDNVITTTTSCSSFPSPSLKSGNSTNSPRRYRRNSSPVIERKLESSPSATSDDFRPRPLSSLVDSVSRTLGRMQQLSDVAGGQRGEGCDRGARGEAELGMMNMEFLPYEQKPMRLVHERSNDKKELVDILSVEDKTVLKNKEFDTIENLNGGDIGNDAEFLVECSNSVRNREESLTSLDSCQDAIITKSIKLTNGGCSDVNNTRDYSTVLTPQLSQNATSGMVIRKDDISMDFENVPQDEEEIGITTCCADRDSQILYNSGNTAAFGPNSPHQSGNKDKEYEVIDGNHGDSDIALFESFSHLIGSRSKPMDIPYSPNSDVIHRQDGCLDFDNPEHSTIPLQNNSISILPFNNQIEKSASSSVTITHDRTTSAPQTNTDSHTLATSTGNEQSAYSDISVADVETGNQSRSLSDSSLDAIASITPRRRAKSGCLCLMPQSLDKTTVVAFAVSSVFVLSFLPFLVLMFVRGMVKDFDYSLDGATLCLYHILLRFYFLNSAINPFLYGLLNVTFRCECVRTWRNLVNCLHGNHKTRHKQDTVL